MTKIIDNMLKKTFVLDKYDHTTKTIAFINGQFLIMVAIFIDVITSLRCGFEMGDNL